MKIWYNCFVQGDEELLVEMVLSIPQHIQNIHHFPDNKKFKVCFCICVPSLY